MVIKMADLNGKLLELFFNAFLGAFAALARLIYTNPSRVTLFKIFLETLMGAFVGLMVALILNAFTSYDSATVPVFTGAISFFSREVLTIAMRKFNKEVKEVEKKWL